MSRRQHSRQKSCQHLAGKDLRSQLGRRADEVLSPAGQSLWWLMPREINMAWSNILVCGAQLLAVVWACLSYTLKVVYSTLLGLLISVWVSPMASGKFPQDPIHGWSHSADMVILILCTDILGVSPCQMCLL